MLDLYKNSKMPHKASKMLANHAELENWGKHFKNCVQFPKKFQKIFRINSTTLKHMISPFTCNSLKLVRDWVMMMHDFRMSKFIKNAILPFLLFIKQWWFFHCAELKHTKVWDWEYCVWIQPKLLLSQPSFNSSVVEHRSTTLRVPGSTPTIDSSFFIDATYRFPRQ